MSDKCRRCGCPAVETDDQFACKCGESPAQEAPAGQEAQPVAFVPRAKRDGEHRVEGEFRWQEIDEKPFKVFDPSTWECCALYAAPPQAPAAVQGDVLSACAAWCDEQAKSDWYGRTAGDMVRAFAQRDAALKLPVSVAKLAQFGAAMLHAHRGTQACEVGDIDGGTAQAEALRCGVLEARQVTEPCGESCVCAEVVDFPTECYFTPDDVAAAIRALKREK